jgi:hypothetical protein
MSIFSSALTPRHFLSSIFKQTRRKITTHFYT